ncbi:hypothetical protein B0G73_12664 [Paraburkholderia sp. BL25I1N1]|nr:hypothetical protein B0G73_12664 [Paraburkholderia sp. BL25I1N1]
MLFGMRLGLWVVGLLLEWGFLSVFLSFVGLSLSSLWSIGVAPVRGGTYFLCLPQRK